MCRRTASEFQATYVRLPRDLHAAIKERAEAEERTMAQTIRLALRLYLSSIDAGAHQ